MLPWRKKQSRSTEVSKRQLGRISTALWEEKTSSLLLKLLSGLAIPHGAIQRLLGLGFRPFDLWLRQQVVCAGRCFSIVEPSRRTIDIKRFEPSEVFPSKEEAEAHGLALAKAWVDQHS